eukprot:g6677.t1
MVQKWVIGALINISGSIAINLGTNLMKLSHKMEKGDTPQQQQQQPDNDKNATTMSPADLEAAESMLAKPSTTHPAVREQSSRYFPSSKGKGKGTGTGTGTGMASPRTHGVEMTTYSAVSASENAGPDSFPHVERSKPSKQGGARTTGAGSRRGRGVVADRPSGGGVGRGGAGIYEEEKVGLMEESSLTGSPSSAAEGSTSSDDYHRAGLPVGGAKPGRPSLASQPRRGSRRGSAYSSTSSLAFSSGAGGGEPINGHDHPQELSGGAQGGHDEHPGVRRRALSSNPNSPLHELLSRSPSISSSEGISGRFLLENGGGGGAPTPASNQQIAWKAKALWSLGAVLLVGGSLVNFASFGFAPQSLLASLGSVQFISNVVFGKVILREIVTRRIIVGTATIILGNTLTLCFSPHQDDNFSTHQLKAFYDLEYNTLLCLELASALAMHATYKSFKRSKEQGKPKHYSDLVMPVAYAICSAIIGTQSVVNAKCLSELLTLTFQGENQMGSPFTYLVMAIWFGTTVFWLVRMNRALAMFHGLFIIPALQVFWTFFSVIGGGFYFEEFHTLHALGGLGFAVGVMVVFCGVYLLAPRTQTDHGSWDGEDGTGSDAEPSDLTKMLRLDVESPAPSPVYAGVKAGLSAGQSLDTSMEAGDEEIDWDHTRMLSLGFFPSISTDQDVAKMGMGKLANNLEGVHDAEAGDAHGHAGGNARVTDAAHRQSTLLPPPRSKPKDTPPRPISPVNSGGGRAAAPSPSGAGAAQADEEARGTDRDIDLEGGDRNRDREGETERRRRRAAGAARASASASGSGSAAVANRRGGRGGAGAAAAVTGSSSNLAPRL